MGHEVRAHHAARARMREDTRDEEGDGDEETCVRRVGILGPNAPTS